MSSYKLKKIVASLTAGALTLCLFVPSALADAVPVGGVTIVKSAAVPQGTLQSFDFKMVQYSDGRIQKVRVWLPKGYDEKNKSKTYPVIYMQDGQSMFGDDDPYEWNVDETISDYVNKGNQGSIVVAVANDGKTVRMKELIDLTPITGKVDDGSRYADFIVKTLKPYIDKHYNTKPQREYTTVSGSSAGGHMTFILAMEHPDIFGYAYVFSPAAIGKPVYKYLKTKNFSNVNSDPYMFVYTGETSDPEASIGQYTKELYSELVKDGYPKSKINFIINEKNSHSVDAWRPYFKDAYKWTLEHPYTSIANAKEININKNQITSLIYSKSYLLPVICVGSAIVLIAVIFTVITHKRRLKRKISHSEFKE